MRHTSPVGIAAIATYEPSWRLPNEWFGPAMPRKFAHHTGIQSRLVSRDDEVTMGVRAVERLQQETGCDLADCAGLVFVSPSFVPSKVSARYGFSSERIGEAGRRLAAGLGLSDRPIYSLNWFCSGYARGLEVVRHRLAREMPLGKRRFYLLVTSGQISRITDYAAVQTAPLFGDMATATMLTRADHRQFPAQLKLLYAAGQRRPVERPLFDFELRDDVLLPTPDGLQTRGSRRFVYTLDGMAIADVAPRAMASAVHDALTIKGIDPESLSYVVPHQAGTAIVRLTGMKLEQLGIRAEVVNGLTCEVGNVSSSSVPYALKQWWDRLNGTIACPTAAVGSPGTPEVLQGCILLRAVKNGRSSARAA
jgi:3-oxoacyl-[acyl-carrier-protein] synthase III